MGKQSKIEPQLLSERDAARWLATSQRKLWGLRADGKIPVVRVGRSVRYDVADLRKFVAANKTGSDHV